MWKASSGADKPDRCAGRGTAREGSRQWVKDIGSAAAPAGAGGDGELAVVAGVLVAIVAVVAAVLTVVNHDDAPTTVSGPAASVPPPVGGSQPSGGPEPPVKGVYVGAYVQPDSDYTPQGRIDAVTDFERKATGRQLDIVQTYHPWDDEFPDADRQVGRGQQPDAAAVLGRHRHPRRSGPAGTTT